MKFCKNLKAPYSKLAKLCQVLTRYFIISSTVIKYSFKHADDTTQLTCKMYSAEDDAALHSQDYNVMVQSSKKNGYYMHID